MKTFWFTLSVALLAGCASTPKDPIASIVLQHRDSTRSALVAPLLKSAYTREELDRIRSVLDPSLEFKLDSRGLARAADRVEADDNDPTHYDAVWVRDSLWVYLGLKSDAAEAPKAKKLLLTLADYFSSPAQVARFRAVIADPSVLAGPDGQMQAVHIRFDRRAPDFADVQEGGKAQTWNHKQNDALGLFLDLFCRAVQSGEISRAELTPERVAAIELLPRYFEAVKFESMPDAGSWEEIERVNTSSIGLVTSGLERLQQTKKFFARVDAMQVRALIDRGYRAITRQLALGGESPQYPQQDPHYRTGDAALLNLIYPAQLSRLTRAQVGQVFKALQPLIGEVGIKRYVGDSYQSGNFWFHTAKTDDTSSDTSFAERGNKLIPGTEAQWFFDSWYSIAAGIAAERFGMSEMQAQQAKFLNRALAQVTGGTRDRPVLGADGKPVPANALPESYNTVVAKNGARAFAPSPITPLNWAKASMRLALARAAARGATGNNAEALKH